MNIGITGSIACGKSTVSDYLIAKGYTIIDADKLGHVALTSNDVKRKLAEKFSDEILEKDENLVFLDIALLFEANFVDLVEKVVVVYVDEDVQLERLMTRNSLSKEEALKRIESQMSPREKASLGDFVINNSYSKEDTFQQIDEIIEKLKRGDNRND